MTTYLEVARALPIPTGEQTRAFAEFVTSAHSWYKHLAIAPPSPFVFFLDPNAGRSAVRLPGGEVTFIDNTEENPGIHYTWQTTETYRRRFGFWNYDDATSPTRFFDADEGFLPAMGLVVQILSPQGEWVGIPERLAGVGTVLLSALMWHPYHPPGRSPSAISDRQQRLDCIFDVWLFSARVGYERAHERLMDVMPMLPDDMRQGFERLLALWMNPAYRQELAETHRAYDEYREAEENAGRRSEASTTDPGFLLYQKAEEAWEMAASRRQEHALLAPLFAALDRERQRQIDAMVRAMNLFVDFVHDNDRHTDARFH